MADREDAPDTLPTDTADPEPPVATGIPDGPSYPVDPAGQTVDDTLVATVPAESATEGADLFAPQRAGAVALEMALWAGGGCFLTVVNRFIGLVAPLPPSTSPLSHALALLYLGGLLFALMQLTRAAARLPASTPSMLLVGLAFAAPMGAVLLLRRMELLPPTWLFLTANNLFLPVGAALAGAGIGRIIRHPNTLLAAAGFALFFDIVVVTMGTVAALTQAQSSLIAAVSVGAGPVAPMARRSYPILSSVTIGPADVLFMALFFASVWLLRLSWRATAAWMYALLIAALAIVELQLLPDWLPGIPALLPMGIAVLIANWPHRAFTAQEKRDLVIGGAFALFCAAAIIFGSRALVRPGVGPVGLQVQRIPTGEHAIVVSVPGGSRAEKNGIRPGDIVLYVNDRRTKGMSQEAYNEAIAKAGETGLQMVIQSPGGPAKEVVFGKPGQPDTPARPISEPPRGPGPPASEGGGATAPPPDDSP